MTQADLSAECLEASAALRTRAAGLAKIATPLLGLAKAFDNFGALARRVETIERNDAAARLASERRRANA